MAAITPVVTSDHVGANSTYALWETITETNDFGNSVEIKNLRDMCVHVIGNFGSGGSLTVYGSNVPADVNVTPASGTWVPVAFSKNGNPATFTATSGGQLLDNYRYITVRLTAGTGVDLDVYLKITHDD